MSKRKNTLNRVLDEARFIVSEVSTVRATAAEFDVSKSTVHRDIKVHLKELNKGLYEEVTEILQTNKAERHMRGGQATKRKYENN